jgi:hypothetical protein
LIGGMIFLKNSDAGNAMMMAVTDLSLWKEIDDICELLWLESIMDATEISIFVLFSHWQKRVRFTSSDVPSSVLPESLQRKDLPLPHLTEVDASVDYFLVIPRP